MKKLLFLMSFLTVMSCFAIYASHKLVVPNVECSMSDQQQDEKTTDGGTCDGCGDGTCDKPDESAS